MDAAPGSRQNDPIEPAALGVAYSTIDGAPGRFFRCQPYHATLSTKACASRWRIAQRATGLAAARFERCRTCPVGAIHAGETIVYYSPLYGKPVCSRCGRSSLRRMILGATLCIS
jgi:hypothetical protein